MSPESIDAEEVWKRLADAGGDVAAYKVNFDDVPIVGGLREDEGWIDMKVQFAISQATAGATEVSFGRTVFAPGSRHEPHRHGNAEEVQYLLRGQGVVYDGVGDGPVDEIPMVAGDIIFTGKGRWHGFINTSDTEDALMIWLWTAASRDEAGYEAKP